MAREIDIHNDIGKTARSVMNILFPYF